MLLSSVVIVLREVLEAALLISIFLVFSHLLKISRKWLLTAFIFGIAGATFYAAEIETISQLLDGVGQELTNALLQLFVALLLIAFNTAIIFYQDNPIKYNRLLYGFLICSVILAITREGSEILLYIYGFFYAPKQLYSVLAGSFIGAGIGFSIGIILYYLLTNISRSRLILTGVSIVTLICAGMVSQAIQQFIQADILPSRQPLWDTSSWLPEESVTGQLLYALIGYEATPSPIQVIFYFSSIVIMLSLAAVAMWRHKPSATQ
jgi:high-affinity iron transporter